jgi:Pyrimidine dimer DNA glycosylase
MWMVPPEFMCRKHLLGEHVELHMLEAHLRLGRRVDGYAANNCVEPRSIGRRHAALAAELARRGYRHASPLRQPPVAQYQRPTAKVDVAAAALELSRRCPGCTSVVQIAETKGRKY